MHNCGVSSRSAVFVDDCSVVGVKQCATESGSSRTSPIAATGPQWAETPNLDTSILSGAPEGSLVAPILISLFINDLPAKINSECLLYADVRLDPPEIVSFFSDSDPKCYRHWPYGRLCLPPITDYHFFVDIGVTGRGLTATGRWLPWTETKTTQYQFYWCVSHMVLRCEKLPEHLSWVLHLR